MSQLCVPGEAITDESGYLRGHGSYIVTQDDGEKTLFASVAGQIERVNKLISVRPLQNRYVGEVGDLVVGRVTSIEAKRWKVDIGGTKDAVLQLSSVNLAEGAQRMRTHEDQMQMRTILEEGDLISAEIQNISSEGTISLHTRSLKYGKLENGQFISISSVLVKRLPQHYVSLPWNVDLILGRNGGLWVTRSIPEDWKVGEGMDGIVPTAETLENLRTRHATTPLLVEQRSAVARVTNIVKMLAKYKVYIDPTTISTIFQASLDEGMLPKDILNNSANSAKLLQSL